MYLSLAVVGVRAFALGKAFFRYSERLVLHDAIFRKATLDRVGLFASLVGRAPIGLREHSVGSILTTLVDDVEDSLNRDLRYKPAVLQSLAVTIAGIIVYLWLVPQSALLMFITLLIGALVTFYGSKLALNSYAIELASLRSELSEMSELLVKRARIIRAYGWQKQSSQRVEDLNRNVTRVEKKLAAVFGGLQSFGVLAMYLTVLMAVIVSFQSGELLPGEQVAVLVLLPLGIYEYLQLIPGAVLVSQKSNAAFERLDALENTLIPEQLISKGHTNLGNFESLELVGATVEYPGGQTVKLPNLRLNAGSSLALMAPSGSGKSSLANVLVGFIQPAGGHFLVNGLPISSFSSESLAKVFGLVEQTPVILAGSIKDNLVLAKPEATDSDLEEVLRAVGLWDVVSKRGGLSTEVGLAGSKLSGGEAQRLAFARTILSGHSVIILDEPTSSLNQKQGFDLLKEFFVLSRTRNATLILITHDKKLSALADQLVKF